MKLGTQTGSVTNHILSRMVIGQPEPEVGMAATLLSWTDRHAGTITETWSYRLARHLVVQEDNAQRTDSNGMSECQTYEYSRNTNGPRHTFRQTKTGTWEHVRFNPKTRRYVKTNGYGLRIGERQEYRDFSF